VLESIGQLHAAVGARCGSVARAPTQLGPVVCQCEGLLLGVLESIPICPSRRCNVIQVTMRQFGRSGCTGSCPQGEF